ncbi:MAG: alcohol dehydrogenase catalytic domain-containing protein [Myxococcales bacterium]|nr:alcohol dehydrogenase catalytic domain-containing protein [Myxococcales bacterium]
MRALVLDKQTVTLDRERAAPERRSGEAIVRVDLAGICDTDIQLARGYMGYSGVIGHEFVGTVLECDTPSLRGRRVVADINAGCGACDDCLARDGHHCASRSVLGILARDGALAERLAIPERCLVALGDGLADERAVFAEPVAAALHVLDALSLSVPANAIVVGDGKLGLLIALSLRGAGVDTMVIGHHERKLAIARNAGCRAALESSLDEHATRALRAPLTVDATGSSSGLARALSLTAPRGTLVLKSTVAEAVTIDTARLVVDEITVVGSRCGDMTRAVTMLANGRIDPTPLIEARYSLDEGERAFDHARSKGSLKVLVAP